MEGILPAGWTSATLGDLGTWTSGGTPSRSHPEYYGGGIPWVKTGDLLDGPVLAVPESITESGLRNSAAKRFPRGTLLVAMYGATIGKLGILEFEAATNQACAALLPGDGTADLVPYVFQYLLSQREELKRIGQGGAQPNISQSILKAYSIPLPPLREQRRIVTKLDALQARSRRAREALDEVPDLLEKLRESILAAAFRGDLTKDWRAKNADVEPAEKLLQRIRAERRKKWEEAELAKMQAKGKSPGNGRWKEGYAEPEPVDATELPTLPPNWCWASGDELFEFVTSGSRGWAEYYSSEGALFVRIGNLNHDSVDLDLHQRQHVRPPPGAEGERTRLRAADVLISITADLGMVAVVPAALGEAYINQHIALARPVEQRIARCVAFYLSTPNAGKGRLLQANRGMTKAGLGLDDIRTVPIALAPLEECELIAKVVQQRLTALSEARNKIGYLGAELHQLDAACLSKAFRGELVPQDPNDEPADVMLARLKAAAASPTSTPVSPPSSGKGRGRPRKP